MLACCCWASCLPISAVLARPRQLSVVGCESLTVCHLVLQGLYPEQHTGKPAMPEYGTPDKKGEGLTCFLLLGVLP